MSEFALFTDGSFDPKTKRGMGALLLAPASMLTVPIGDLDQNSLSDSIKFHSFTDTSSTQLEIKTALWAIDLFSSQSKMPLTLYTDSQGVAGLIARRTRLESTGFISQKSKRELNLAPLYRQFYAFHDKIKFRVVKVSGHQRKSAHTTTQRIFSMVDQGARKALQQSRKFTD